MTAPRITTSTAPTLPPGTDTNTAQEPAMTSPNLIDTTTALAALDRVVCRYGAMTLYANRDPEYDPDTHKGTCRYVREDEPCCLVAVVMAEEFGVTVEDLAAIEGHAPLAVSGDIPEADRVFGRLAPGARRLLTIAQDAQDQGLTWGDALDLARTYVAESE